MSSIQRFLGSAPSQRLARLLLMVSSLAVQAQATAQEQTIRPALWVGSSDGKIRVFDLTDRGKLRLRTQMQGPKPLRFLAFHPELPLAYGAVGRRVQTYRIERSAGRTKIAPTDSVDAAVRGTHVEVDPAGRYVFLASYGDGAVLALPLDARGRTGPATFTIRTPHQLCQKAHQVRAHPLGKFVYAPCLGDDVLQILSLTESGVRSLGRARLATGSGPRHLDFDPGGQHLYVLNELSSSIYAYRVDQSSGALTEIQVVDALPATHQGGSRSSDIHVSSDGRFVYAVHRQPLDQIVTLAVRKDGRLRVVGRSPTGGVHSRSFALSGDGHWVVLGHSKTRNIVARRIDPQTGLVGLATCEVRVEAAAIFVGFAPRK